MARDRGEAAELRLRARVEVAPGETGPGVGRRRGQRRERGGQADGEQGSDEAMSRDHARQLTRPPAAQGIGAPEGRYSTSRTRPSRTVWSSSSSSVSPRPAKAGSAPLGPTKSGKTMSR